MFTELFITIERSKQPKCLSFNEWINKIWYIFICTEKNIAGLLSFERLASKVGHWLVSENMISEVFLEFSKR